MIYHNFDNIDSLYSFNEPLLTFPNLIENDNDINDCFLNEEDNRRYYIHNSNISQHVNARPFLKQSYNFDRTSYITDKRLKNIPKNDNNVPLFYSLDTIRGILIQNEDFNNRLIDKIVTNDQKVIESEEYMKTTKKKYINNFFYQDDNFKPENFINFEYEEVKEKDNFLKIKRGRKTKRDNVEEHNRYDADNIIKKIKAKIIDYCLKFINKIINKKDEEKIQLLKIDYKYIDQLERKANLDLFEMTLKDLFSLDISRKYKTKSEDYNKILINGILEEKIEIEDFDTIKSIFEITLNDWIDLFTYKKDTLTLVNGNNTKIQENFVGVNRLLNKISEKGCQNDDKYYTLFLLYLFNFQRWFYIKKGRILKKKGRIK